LNESHDWNRVPRIAGNLSAFRLTATDHATSNIRLRGQAMNPLICPISFALILLSSAASLQAGDDPNHLERMQGRWTIASLTEKGNEVPAKELEALVVVIEKDTFTTIEKDQVVAKYRLKLDPSKNPPAVDFTHLVGETKDKIEPGIYLFGGDLLKFVLDEDRKGRPTVFEGKETASYSV